MTTTTKTGEEEDGYAEALIRTGQEGWFPVRIRADDAEARVSDGTGEPI